MCVLISLAAAAQRDAVRDLACVVCATHPAHPAHPIDRSLAPRAGDAVVPLCPVHHRDYDDGDLDLLPCLEPRRRENEGWAVEAIEPELTLGGNGGR